MKAKMFFLKVSLCAVTTFGFGVANAEMQATPLSGDTRLVTFEYDPENTYLILSKPKAHTHIVMPEGETIETIVAGDTSNWELITPNNMKHLFIKPKYENMQTSITVITSGRTYQLIARSTAEGKKWYQQVAWEVPQGFVFDQSNERTAGTQASIESSKHSSVTGVSIDPTKLNYDYKISGNEPFKPTQVFDDGKMIWLKMPKNLTELPAVFGKDGRDLVLVNYLVKGDFIVVQQLTDQLVLKIGKRDVNIAKNTSRFWSAGNTTD